MSWSPQQDAALKSVAAWMRDPNGPQIFRLFGYAGTGKTTLAKQVAKSTKGNVLFAAYTGKAAMQLRRKGCEASTIHSLIYKPEQNDTTGEVSFVLNTDSELKDAALLVVDEVSMVGEELARDLLSFKVRILALGDPAQLPPVKGEGFFINAAPDVMLTEVHRQAADNPIIRMSMLVREGGRLPLGDYGESRVINRSLIDQDELRAITLSADQVLCGLNKTRVAYNRRIRSLKGLGGGREPWKPVRGDRLICLRNNAQKALFNGGLWQVHSVQDKFGRFDLDLFSLDEDRAPIGALVLEEFFTGDERKLDYHQRRDHDEFTFGWAITCHKSQGSEWDKVVVFDESGAFRESRMNWLYTAVTRAAERVTVVA